MSFLPPPTFLNIFAWWKHRSVNGVIDVVNAGAPTNGTSGTGAGFASPGSTYFDTTNYILYRNINTRLSPYWLAVDVSPVQNFAIRTRNTVAEVNAGATLLPALALYKYRVIDMAMISVGGAAATATTVDIIGTVSTARKLLAVAVAALTQSALVRAGASNATILADGASFTANDVNTAITIGKTGSNVATATHIDTLITYALDKA